jgi:hypothetical protein
MSARTSLAVMLVGLAVMVVIAWLRPHGMGKVYERTIEKSFVEAEIAPPVGADTDEKPTLEWIAADDPRLAEGTARSVGSEPVGWTERKTISATAAWRGLAKDPDAPIALSWRGTVGLWFAAILTLAILSFLIGDNPIYKIAESMLIGVSAGYWMVLGFWSTIVPNLLKPLAPQVVRDWALPSIPVDATTDWWALVPLALGVMLLWRLAPRGGWIATWPIAFIVGTTAGLKLISFTQADLLAQASASMVPLWVTGPDGSWQVGRSLGNLVLVASLVSVLVYFLFSVEHRGAVGKVSRFGVWVLMITFGAAFGFTVMGRITLLAQRFGFLFDDWLWLVDPNGKHDPAALATAASATVSALAGG